MSQSGAEEHKTTTGTMQAEISNSERVEDALVSEVFSIPAGNIYIKVPAGYIRSSKGSTSLFKKPSMETFIAIVAVGYEEGNAKTLSDAHRIAAEYFALETNVGGGIKDLHIGQESAQTVSGIEMYRFVGELEYKVNNEKTYAVGYSFIMDDIPCMVIGGIMNGEYRNDESVDEITKIVDAAVQTLRSE